ncbi:MAG TPA: hypothetical protein DEO94_02075 [Cyanobacteria bacterium UBA11991]|nr:hypothetical protein [Cyanobacteriota bacterium]MDY6359149.1 hypothetical protein [Cyanobacteriota bacterium]MDY6363557.1 hypothetical protein [Cyanobacteriota bacterium]MDY6382538.1 hypothetical protein [Cyanobacteriota bacterium]HCB10939.1 hypothetical protein [Cyanobacteria bacterium UBA11991]
MHKKFLSAILLMGLIFFTGCTNVQTATKSNLIGMPNPWTDCGKDFECAQKASSVTFPVANISVRAMDGMVEVFYPIDAKRTLILRKTNKEIENMSGVYTKYPVNKKIKLDNDVAFKIRGTKDLIYVADFSAESGYYSFYCENGFTKNELERFYNILAEFESSRI